MVLLHLYHDSLWMYVINLPMSFGVTSLASASKVTVKDTGKNYCNQTQENTT